MEHFNDSKDIESFHFQWMFYSKYTKHYYGDPSVEKGIIISLIRCYPRFVAALVY